MQQGEPMPGVWRQSEQTRREIDMEIRSLIESAYRETRELIEANGEFLHMIAESLLAHETLDGEEADIVYRCFRENRLSGKRRKPSGGTEGEEKDGVN